MHTIKGAYLVLAVGITASCTNSKSLAESSSAADNQAAALVDSLAHGELADAPRKLLAAYPGQLHPPAGPDGRDWTSTPEPWGGGQVSVRVRKNAAGEPVLVDMTLDLKRCVDVRQLGADGSLYFANDPGVRGFRFAKWNESQRITIMGAPETACLERIVALDRS
ncbi:hypothetical protein [Pseudoxanthomonas daejeonensis]|uniref:hypothetical protein n=1 Tax=Pseudoxanthomonas daejeonensis TaxID=266062 RepID=UPI0013919E94|nr:hypothetical protein [Pseudoxanthomonas daejeonensis]